MIRNVLGAVVLVVAVFAARAESDIAGLLKGGSQSSPESPSVADDSARRDSVIVRGTVVAVDPENRLFALQNSSGKTAIIYAGEEVENFEKLSLGRQATVRYAEAAVLALARNGVFRQQKAKSEPEPATESSSLQSSESIADLMRPQISLFGKVSAVDPRNGYLTVENENGWQIEMYAPSNKTIAGVKIGERVLVTYAEAAAISIQPD